ncbi:MAG: biotin--[acetyl-CoA-carboxylase] ligase [Chloroflexota bacterium]|nr:biotin--[acetyl-CoA-carboxylase] ligase [Chloroflexota bacterium]
MRISSAIEEAIRASGFWHQIVRLDRVGSTNDVAKELASRGAPEGVVVVAEEQTAGRGRMDRRWVAPARSSLLCSILLRPQLSPRQANQLTMLCSMAAAAAIERVAGLPVLIKWPNDLVVRTTEGEERPERWRKVAGILTETGVVGGDLEFTVVGIGINVNVTRNELPHLAPDATSLRVEVGREVERAALLLALLKNVELRYEGLTKGRNPAEEWSTRLATLGRRIRATTAEGALEGVADAVDDDGALLVRTDDGTVHRLMSGDVTLSAA